MMETRLTLIIIFFSTFLFSQSLDINKRTTKDSIYIDFINPLLAPVEMILSPRDSTKNYIKVKTQFVVYPNDTIKNGLIIPKSKLTKSSKTSISSFVSITGKFGDPQAIKHDDDYLYSFPFPKGKRYKIMQGFNGKFSHRLKSSKYAIDFDIKVGDTISAARDGLVIFVKEDSKEHGPTRAYMGKANKIIIMHNDGTFAQYLHLDYNGIFVNEGDKVNVAQPIDIRIHRFYYKASFTFCNKA